MTAPNRTPARAASRPARRGVGGLRGRAVITALTALVGIIAACRRLPALARQARTLARDAWTAGRALALPVAVTLARLGAIAVTLTVGAAGLGGRVPVWAATLALATLVG
ncbi:MAG: hypothetical protein ACRD0K_06675, partial [Egibacteraceae bacterium]